MGDLLWLVGVILVVWLFVSILNKLWGKKGNGTSSHYDRDDILDRLDDDKSDDSNDYDYDNDND